MYQVTDIENIHHLAMKCYIHDPVYISKIKPVINVDLQNSKRVTSSDVNQLSIKEKMKEKVAKMFEGSGAKIK
ncbi:hypothetical protein COM11_25130 [Bacillus pseudomycoides]|nr:hypothetical protein COM11_25130 [Bacillus pseudomycoides]